ncbi:LysM peptidoglycan-binding domain-containing protein [Bacillus sp. H-16]|uniref:LysM peptidoglycan-binding domain-containing protein n=1 Tax=Alteribacter salitolerans TaxID=2912333 RepID=UPI001965FE10|nr:LysM peptidoglycan-binding domain-containing protein [Alteribacter salitolerans]MBM7094499.1 LysM peptidoglycan-binding domain-containing protein [Alteribacter salitolerans]
MAILDGTHSIHTVQAGDTLYSLALRYESDVEDIIKANALYPPFTEQYTIFPGEKLIIPKRYPDRSVTLYTVSEGETLGAISKRFGTTPDLIAGMNDTIQNPDFIYPYQQVSIPAVIYVIEEGDSLFTISHSLGVSLQKVLTANQFRTGISPDLIYEGTFLIIPLPTSGNIVVFEPRPGAPFNDGGIISGLARAFEANVLYRLVDQNDKTVSGERFTTAALAGPAYGSFVASVPFDNLPTSDTGTLWVYTRSAEDGSVQDLVKLKVSF